MDMLMALLASPAVVELRQDFQPTPPEPSSEIANSSINPDNEESSRVPVAMPGSDRLSQLPQENRFRIYDSLFEEPVLRFCPYSHRDCPPIFDTQKFPLKIMDTNRLLRSEIEHYIANFVKVRLWTKTGRLLLGSRYYVPGVKSQPILERIRRRYTRVITCLETDRYTYWRRHAIIHEMPNLRDLSINDGSTKIFNPHYHPRKFYNGTIEIEGNQAADYIGKYFRAYDPPHPTLNYSRKRNINIRFKLIFCFETDESDLVTIYVRAVHTVEVSIKANGGQTVRVVAEVFEEPMSHRDYNLFGDLIFRFGPGEKDLVPYHNELLDKVLSE
jgi:hypothetical protein